jgi:hypothetical protein
MGALGKTMAGWWFQTAVEVSIVIAIMLLYIWLVVSNMTGLFSISWDVIPTPLTNSIIFQRG